MIGMNLMKEPLFKPKSLEEIILAGMAEMMPPDQVKDIFHLPNIQAGIPSFQLASIPGLLIEKMDPASAAGVMIRAGRSSFKYLFDAWGEELGLMSIEYRLSPQPKRIRRGLEKLSSLFTHTFGYPSSYVEDSFHFTWYFHVCPFCIPASTRQPVCFFAAGLFQEFFGWASGGKYFSVYEIRCLAHNEDCCEICIDKVALD